MTIIAAESTDRKILSGFVTTQDHGILEFLLVFRKS
jgi:hypothetical protein